MITQPIMMILNNYVIYNFIKMDLLPKLPSDESLHISNEGLDYILKNFNTENPQKNFLWTTDYRVELPVRVKKSGIGSETPYTFNQMWQETLKKFPNNNALNFEVSPGKWITWNYQQYYGECAKFAKALIALEVRNYTAVNIIGFNSPEWAVAFSGSILGNFLPIGIYTTNGP